MLLNEGLFVFVVLKERLKLGDRGYLWGVIGLVCKFGKFCVVDEVYLRCFDDLLVSYDGICVF